MKPLTLLLNKTMGNAIMKKVWTVGSQRFTSKNAAYREARRLNGKKAGGNRPYRVQRETAK